MDGHDRIKLLDSRCFKMRAFIKRKTKGDL